MAKNKNLNAAARAKKDEFYTQLTDIDIGNILKAKFFFATVMILSRANFSFISR